MIPPPMSAPRDSETDQNGKLGTTPTASMPVAVTNTPPPIRTLVGKALAIIAREGKLIVSSVTRSYAAGATPRVPPP
jgi:hypothetical protein